MNGSALRSSPAAERNASSIASVLDVWLRETTGTLLEVGCGTGQHAAVMAPRLSAVHWQPTDVEPDTETILGWRARSATPARIARPAALDVTERAHWSAFSGISAILTVNTFHIMPWRACVSFLDGAASVVETDGLLFVYGPMHVHGQPTGPGNARFDESLRGQDGAMGIRDISAVRAAAAMSGWVELAMYQMPADNRMLVWAQRMPAHA